MKLKINYKIPRTSIYIESETKIYFKRIKNKRLQFNIMYIHSSYRIEHAMEINIFRKIDLNSETLIFRKIVYAVNIHREAMKLVLYLFRYAVQFFTNF